ncbi:MAG TPA: CorA family divalent cation transporter [Burkholderiaceae bacterium]|nr:CorA family divalent cation transporter [Burkholderiaceae bacterium]
MLQATAQKTHAYVGPEHGLICGFELGPDGESRSIGIDEVATAVASGNRVVWLHFNAANAGARRWLAQQSFIPPDYMQLIEEHETRIQLTALPWGLIGVLSDLAYGEPVDPSEIVTVWAFAASRILVTARNHAAKTADRLRQLARVQLEATSGQALLLRLLEAQAEVLRDWIADAAHELDHAEDQILIGNVTRQRETLGKTRRLAMHLRRHFGPLRGVLQKLLAVPPERNGNIEAAAWRTLHEDLAFAVDEAASVYERAKLLQEELASRLAEATSHNLFVLTIATIVFLPMTLLTGIFGMNVQGVPGVGEGAPAASFWWVMLLIVVAGALTFLLLRLRKLI